MSSLPKSIDARLPQISLYIASLSIQCFVSASVFIFWPFSLIIQIYTPSFFLLVSQCYHSGVFVLSTQVHIVICLVTQKSQEKSLTPNIILFFKKKLSTARSVMLNLISSQKNSAFPVFSILVLHFFNMLSFPKKQVFHRN